MKFIEKNIHKIKKLVSLHRRTREMSETLKNNHFEKEKMTYTLEVIEKKSDAEVWLRTADVIWKSEEEDRKSFVEANNTIRLTKEEIRRMELYGISKRYGFSKKPSINQVVGENR
jgi:hypothetical protein